VARLFSLLPECVAMASKDEGGKQYFIAVVPPQPVYDDAQRLKEYFRDSYGSKAALNSPPHITLHMPFLWKESREDRLTHALSRFAGDNGPVKICLDGFSCFRPRVIFLDVAESEALTALQHSLHKFMKQKLNLFNANYQDRPFHPHLTLAFRDLRKEQFARAWDEFQEREFKAEFIADRIILLKHNGRMWESYKEFVLESSYSAEVNPDLSTTEG
jgi:2'-5' RNA ligase